MEINSNDGLYDLLRVLVGSVHVCVGTLMARRAGELDDLVPGEALDAQQANLIFRNRKSGESSHRAIEARPIPPLGAKLIRMLERLHVVDRRAGSSGAPLFTYPAKYSGKLVTNGCRSYSCLDQFSDYFELPGREPGTRYYLRQHQLRQFFAVCFFWSSGFGGLDTLRWFLGHMDPRHVWHYISRSVPGEILRVVQVDYAIQKVRSGSADAESLAELLMERYGTRDFSVIETPELQRYLDRLVEVGNVRIEPEFFESDCGETFRIVILVKGARPEPAQHG